MNIWIVEDDAGYRRNLRMSLELEEGVSVGRVFPSCNELFDALNEQEAPDIILMDLGLPGISGIEAIHRLSETAPSVRVLVLTVFKDKGKVQQALDAGAAGYLLKESDGPKICSSLRAVFEGDEVLSPAVV